MNTLVSALKVRKSVLFSLPGFSLLVNQLRKPPRRKKTTGGLYSISLPRKTIVFTYHDVVFDGFKEKCEGLIPQVVKMSESMYGKFLGSFRKEFGEK